MGRPRAREPAVPEVIDPESALAAWLRWPELQVSADLASPAGLRGLADHLDQAIGPPPTCRAVASQLLCWQPTTRLICL